MFGPKFGFNRLLLWNNMTQADLNRRQSTTDLYQSIIDSLHCQISGLTEELDETHLARVRLRNERTALREQISLANRDLGLMEAALSKALLRAEGLQSALDSLHTRWAPDRPAGDPLKSDQQLLAFTQEHIDSLRS